MNDDGAARPDIAPRFPDPPGDVRGGDGAARAHAAPTVSGPPAAPPAAGATEGDRDGGEDAAADAAPVSGPHAGVREAGGDEASPPDAAHGVSGPPAGGGESGGDEASPPDGGPAQRLLRYGERLRKAGEPDLAAAVDGYARRVERVRRGALPSPAGAASRSLSPAMVGDALGRAPGGAAGSAALAFLEAVRNVLIFMPVLWMWVKFRAAISGYGAGGGETAETPFFAFWVGGAPGVQPLADAAFEVIALLAALVAFTAGVGMARSWASRARERSRAREARSFAAALADAEGSAAERRADTPGDALAGFAAAGRSLASDVRSIGQRLGDAAGPLAGALDVARRIAEEGVAANQRQEERIAAIAAALADVPGIAQRLDGTIESLGEVADALDGIRDGVQPRADEIAVLLRRLESLAGRIEAAAAENARATENYGSSLVSLEQGLDLFRSAAVVLNEVANRIRDEQALPR